MLNQCLATIMEWIRVNKLKFSPNKIVVCEVWFIFQMNGVLLVLAWAALLL